MPAIRISNHLNADVRTADRRPGSGFSKYFKGDTAGFVAVDELANALDKSIATLTPSPLGLGLSFAHDGSFGSSGIDWKVQAGAMASVSATQAGGTIPGDKVFGKPIQVGAGATFVFLRLHAAPLNRPFRERGRSQARVFRSSIRSWWTISRCNDKGNVEGLAGAEAIACVRLKRQEANQNLGFASRPFVLCGLPVKKPGAGQLLHERRNGQFSLQVTGHPSYGLPWGQDRLIPIFLATLAIRQQSQFGSEARPICLIRSACSREAHSTGDWSPRSNASSARPSSLGPTRNESGLRLCIKHVLTS